MAKDRPNRREKQRRSISQLGRPGHRNKRRQILDRAALSAYSRPVTPIRPAPRLRVAGVVVLTLAAALNLQLALRQLDFYRGLYKQFPFYVPETLKSALQILLCIVALYIAHGARHTDPPRDLGLTRRPLPALLFGLIVSAPMLLGLALVQPLPSALPASIVYLAFISPFAEEVVFRGFAFRQLYRSAGLPLWLSALATAIVFGLGHVAQGRSMEEAAQLFAITGAGGLFFSWLFARWEDNLWVPFFTHALMNLWWEIFTVSKTALGGAFAFGLQLSVVAAAILVTLLKDRWKPSNPAA